MKNTENAKNGENAANESKEMTTEMVFILDKSGSMSGLESDTIGGFNSMIEKQKKEPGKAYVSTLLFDTTVSTLHDRLPLDRIGKMTGSDYVPGGCTALLDAVGCAVDRISAIHKYIRPEDVPQKTVFVITTDGLENASRRFDSATVRKMIGEKKELGWEFLFLGANIDAVETAGSIGIGRDRAVTYTCDARGTALNYKVMSETIGKMRRCEAVPESWKEEIENDRKNRK